MISQMSEADGELKGLLPPHLALTYRTWANIQSLAKAGEVEINGSNLDIATVVAVARWVIPVQRRDSIVSLTVRYQIWMQTSHRKESGVARKTGTKPGHLA